jgi:plasmid stability protein
MLSMIALIALKPQEGWMASLTIRKLPDDVKQELRERAARNGRSLEEEARRALIALVRPERVEPRESIGQMIYRMSRPGFDLPELPDTPIDFSALEAE